MIFSPQNSLFLGRNFLSSSPQNHLKTSTPSNLLKLGISQSVKSLNLFLSFLLSSQKSHLLLHLFSQLSPNSIKPNSETLSLVAHSLLKSQQFKEANEFISHAKRFGFVPQKGLWDSLIQSICVDQESPERAFSILNQCVKEYGILPSIATFRSLVLKFSSTGEMERAIEVLELMRSENVQYPFDNFVCSSVVSGFSRTGKLEVGLKFYEGVEKACDFQPNLVTYSAVVDALCRVGRIDEACELVQAVEERGMALDVVLYDSLICGYFKKGFLMEGLQEHRLMVEKGIAPDVISFTNLVVGLCKEGNVEKTVGFLHEMEKKGMRPNLITYTVVLQGFCNKDKMEEAFSVLKRMEELGLILDKFVYTILIDGLCRRGDLDKVYSLLQEMEGKGLHIGPVTYNTVINGLCKAGNMGKADEISRVFFGDNFTYSTLLDGYSKKMDALGVIETKRRLEEAGICIDVVTYNVLIKALFMLGMIEDACQLFKDMHAKGVAANIVTYCTMVDGLCKLGKMDMALAIFEDYRRSLPLLGDACHICIIRGLCKEHLVDMAIELFKELAEHNLVPNTVAFMKLIKAQFQDGNGEGVLKLIHRIENLEPELLSSMCNDALEFLCTKYCLAAALDTWVFMRRRGLPVTRKSYYLILKRLIGSGDKLVTELLMCDCIKVNGTFGPRMTNILSLYLCKKNAEEAIRFLADTNKRDIAVSISTAVVAALKKEGRAQDALMFLMEAEQNGAALDVVVYSIVVDGLLKDGYLEKALDLCASMRKTGIHPNVVTYNIVLNNLCQQGCLVEALRIFDSLEPNGVHPTVITYAILIHGLSREGYLQAAEQLFRSMVLKGITPSTQIFNSLIYGYCSIGLIDEAKKILLELEESSVEPDTFTVSYVISGCCLKGDIEVAYSFFDEYKGRGLSPNFLGYLSLAKGFFTKGRMKEARDILRDMLQCTTVVNLINRAGSEQAGDELHVESLVNLLARACDEGRIQDVIKTLSEIGSVAFPSSRSYNSSGLRELTELQEIDSDEKIPADGGASNLGLKVPIHCSPNLAAGVADVNNGMCNIAGRDSNLEDNGPLSGKSLYSDFNTCYSAIANLCSKGDLQKASCLVKKMLVSSCEHVESSS